MNILASKRSWILSPILFFVGVALLVSVWACMDGEALRSMFDNNGRSVFELMTIPFYALIVPAVWMACPFGGSAKRKFLLCSAITCIAVMAVLKQLDLHIAALSQLYPDVVDSFKGTPFKMRFLTNGSIPFGAKAFVVMYFILFFGVFAAMLVYYARDFIKGVFRLNPVAWTFGCLGASGVMVQIFDRLPAWYRKSIGISKDALQVDFTSFCTALEEGGEMMLAAFALTAILQAHLIYGNSGEKYADK